LRGCVLNRHYLNGSVSASPELRAQEQAESALIERSGLFDRVWYIAQFPEIAHSALDPTLDYIRHGAREGRNPNPLFEGEWYLARHPDARGGSPLIHYLLHGAAEGREPGPFFDTRWYLAQQPELNSQLRAIERQAIADALAPIHPGDSFNLTASASGGAGAGSAIINPLAHYLKDGWLRGFLPFDPARLLAGMKVAVIVHLFYADLWGEITGFLRNIPIGFDLFVSVPREHAGALTALVLRDHPQAQVVEVPNAGRDVGAFLAVLPRLIAANYSVLCKLHSKKGTQYPAAWRDLLLRGVLANKMLVARILHAFASSPELVLVGARDVYLSGAAQMTKNREKLEEITQVLCPGRSLPDNWGFFAGTMFWARPDFFRPFAQIADSLGSFEGDNSRGDGQLAHAVERMFGALAALEGKHIGLTEITGPRPLEGTIRVTQAPAQPWEGSFVRVLRAHALELAGELPVGRALAPPSYGETSRHKSSRSKHARKVIARFGIAALMRSRGARVSERISRLPRYARRPLNLLWWTLTLQIVPRLRDFCIKRAQARLVASSPLFDRNWYLERYPSVRAADVDPAFHYVARGVADACDPGPRFDTMWYLAYYSDVAAWGINPLVHYLRQGAKEGRHTNPREIVIGEVTDAALSCRKFPGAAGEVSLFVTHSPHGLLKPHVRHHLEALRRHGISPVLIVAADAEFREPNGVLLALLDGLYVRQNVGYDFAAWAHVLRENPKLLSADILYLINDSTIGPLNEQKFAALLRKVRCSKNDLVGLTDSYERGWHIQSYFLALKRTALSSAALQGFLAGVKNLAEKRAVVNAYEARLASILQGVGLRCEVLYPARNARNPSLVDWRALIDSGLPFVKVAALRNLSRRLDDGDWRTVLQAEGFDPGLADRALRMLSD
jgi:lipopolysaccharide biosynthesis protein